MKKAISMSELASAIDSNIIQTSILTAQTNALTKILFGLFEVTLPPDVSKNAKENLIGTLYQETEKTLKALSQSDTVRDNGMVLKAQFETLQAIEALKEL